MRAAVGGGGGGGALALHSAPARRRNGRKPRRSLPTGPGRVVGALAVRATGPRGECVAQALAAASASAPRTPSSGRPLTLKLSKRTEGSRRRLQDNAGDVTQRTCCRRRLQQAATGATMMVICSAPLGPAADRRARRPPSQRPTTCCAPSAR